MALQVSIAGPGLDESHRLEPGGAPLTLGRDPDCSVCLPDTERNVSRRHLRLWNEGGELHFEVLSSVNGVFVDAQEMFPGARGVATAGQVLLLSTFRIEFGPAPVLPPDPWDDFEREAARLVAAASALPENPEDDPFGDWGFQSTFGPGAPDDAVAAARLAPSTELASFFHGLGLPAPAPDSLTQAELETMGRLTRMALQGLVKALEAAGPSGQPERDPGQPANPLRMDTPLESKLWYLFGGQAAGAGCLPPDVAVGELVGELMKLHIALVRAKRHTGGPVNG